MSICYQTILQGRNLNRILKNDVRVFAVSTYSIFMNCGHNFTGWFSRILQLKCSFEHVSYFKNTELGPFVTWNKT